MTTAQTVVSAIAAIGSVVFLVVVAAKVEWERLSGIVRDARRGDDS